MADKLEPLVTINIANIFKQLHDIGLKEAKSKIPDGFVIKNLAFSDDKVTEMKAGEYLITIAPEDDMDKSLFLDDELRPKAEEALQTYIQFFVDKKVDPKDFSEIIVADDSADSDDEKKEEKNDNQQNKSEEKQEKPASESLRIKRTRNNLLNYLFDDYQFLNEEGEDKQETQNAKADDKKTDDKKEDDNKDGNGPKSKVKVRGLSVKYECKLAGQKTGKLGAALKKGAKSILGGIWNDLTQIKITGGVFGKDGLAVGKVLDPDTWKETLGRPDIDANIIKSDIDTVFQKDYPNNTVAVKIHKCSGLMSLIKKSGAKASSGLVKALSEAEMCIAITVQKNDENYDSYNEESIAEVINKSIGNYYKSVLTHPLKFTVSKDDIYKVENFNEEGKRIDTPKDTQTPNKESISFLTYCALVESGNILLEDGEDTEDTADTTEKTDKDDNAKPDETKIEDVKKKFEKNIESAADVSKVDINSITSDYGTIQDIKIKVKKLEPVNVADVDKITGDGTTAFFVDFKLKDAVKDSMIEQYPSMLRKLFESQYLLEENEIKNTQQETFIKAINETAKQISKDIKIKDDISPVVFNYGSEDSKDKEKSDAVNDSLTRDLHLLKFIYNDEILNEANKKKTDQKKLNKVKELIKSKINTIRSTYADKKDDFIKYVYSDQGQQLAWTKGKEAENNNFNKFIDEIFSNDSPEETAKKIASMSSNNNFRNDIIYRFIAPVEKLEATQEKVKIRLFDADPATGEKTGDHIAEFEVEKGQPMNSTDEAQKAFENANKQLENSKKEGFEFRGWSKDASEKAEADTDLVAKYLANEDKDKEFTVVFQYPPDPNKEDDIKEVPGDLGTQKIKAGESAEEPEPPEIDGWKFKKWSDDTHNVTDDMMVVAEYKKPIIITFKVPKDPKKPDGETEEVGDPIEFEEGTPINAPKPPEKEGYEFEKWDPNPDDFKPEESTEIIGTYKEKEEEEKQISSGILHEVYVVVDPYNLAQADKKTPDLYYVYRPKDPSKLGDKKKDGSIDVENGSYTLAQKDPIEKTDDDSFNAAIEKLIPKGYEKENPSSGFAYDGIEEIKKPKDGKPGIMVMKFKGDEAITEKGNDLYVYVSKKIKYKNEKSVGRKDKKMMNGNAYST